MQHFNIRLGKNIKTVSIPTRWEEVTFRQLMAINEANDDWLKIFGVFLDEPAELIGNARVDNGGLDELLICLSFLTSTEIPKVLPTSIMGYDLPKDLGFETIGQYQYIREDVAASASMTPIEQMRRYALYCAVYAQPQDNLGEFDFEKAEALAEKFMNAPAMEVLAVGSFTVVKLIGLSRPINDVSRRPITRMKRLRLAIQSWLVYTVSTARLWLWKKRLASGRRSYTTGTSTDSTRD